MFDFTSLSWSASVNAPPGSGFYSGHIFALPGTTNLIYLPQWDDAGAATGNMIFGLGGAPDLTWMDASSKTPKDEEVVRMVFEVEHYTVV